MNLLEKVDEYKKENEKREQRFLSLEELSRESVKKHISALTLYAGGVLSVSVTSVLFFIEHRIIFAPIFLWLCWILLLLALLSLLSLEYVYSWHIAMEGRSWNTVSQIKEAEIRKEFLLVGGSFRDENGNFLSLNDITIRIQDLHAINKASRKSAIQLFNTFKILLLIGQISFILGLIFFALTGYQAVQNNNRTSSGSLIPPSTVLSH